MDRNEIYDSISLEMRKDDGYIEGVAQSRRIHSLSQEQRDALDAIDAFVKSSAKQFVLGGVAGSGKSTIIPYIQRLYHHVRVCAYTGKAVTVLLRKGIIGARTLHSFLYRATTEKLPSGEMATVFTPMPDIMFGNISLVVVDEASMVNKEIYDLLSSKHFKVIYIGDHFQLPPVKDTFNIMENPDFKMEAVLRQNEHNPIIMLATKARIGEPIPYGKFGDSYHTMNLQEKDLVKFNQVITWTNAAKDHFNESIRRILGYNSNQPTAGDKMIVKVNCRAKNLYNGQIVYIHGMPAPCQSQRLWRVGLFDELAHNDAFVMASTDSAINCVASVHLTKEELDKLRMNPRKKSGVVVHLDWGYAITCHASQGSSWKKVAVVDEKRHKNFNEFNRWTYTAITRAEEMVGIYTI